jgi:hypothetical protein
MGMSVADQRVQVHHRSRRSAALVPHHTAAVNVENLNASCQTEEKEKKKEESREE